MRTKSTMAGIACVMLGSASIGAWASEPTAKSCEPSGNLNYICGMENPEDLAVLPGDRWIIASGMAEKSGLHLIDAEAKTAERWIAPTSGKATAPFGQCPSQPPADELQIHGISLHNHGDGRATLYAVNHGGKGPIETLSVGRGRETIEVFSVLTEGGKPTLSWQGCVPMPGELVANGVVWGPDGTLYATVMLHPENGPNDGFDGTPTGAVYRWSPDEPTFKRVGGTELPGNNGIEVSRDGKVLYVVALDTLTKFTNTDPAVRLESVRNQGGFLDNIHWVGDKLVGAGPRTDVCPPDANGVPCLKGYRVFGFDPDTLATTVMVEDEGVPSFSVASVGLPVGKTLWLGSYASDRAAYRPLP